MENFLDEVRKVLAEFEQWLPGVLGEAVKVFIDIPEAKAYHLYDLAQKYGELTDRLGTHLERVGPLTTTVSTAWTGDGAAAAFSKRARQHIQKSVGALQLDTGTQKVVQENANAIEMMKFMACVDIVTMLWGLYSLIMAALATFGIAAGGIGPVIAGCAAAIRKAALELLEKLTEAGAKAAPRLLAEALGKTAAAAGTKVAVSTARTAALDAAVAEAKQAGRQAARDVAESAGRAAARRAAERAGVRAADAAGTTAARVAVRTAGKDAAVAAAIRSTADTAGRKALAETATTVARRAAVDAAEAAARQAAERASRGLVSKAGAAGLTALTRGATFAGFSGGLEAGFQTVQVLEGRRDDLAWADIARATAQSFGVGVLSTPFLFGRHGMVAEVSSMVGGTVAFDAAAHVVTDPGSLLSASSWAEFARHEFTDPAKLAELEKGAMFGVFGGASHVKHEAFAVREAAGGYRAATGDALAARADLAGAPADVRTFGPVAAPAPDPSGVDAAGRTPEVGVDPTAGHPEMLAGGTTTSDRPATGPAPGTGNGAARGVTERPGVAGDGPSRTGADAGRAPGTDGGRAAAVSGARSDRAGQPAPSDRPGTAPVDPAAGDRRVATPRPSTDRAGPEQPERPGSGGPASERPTPDPAPPDRATDRTTTEPRPTDGAGRDERATVDAGRAHDESRPVDGRPHADVPEGRRVLPADTTLPPEPKSIGRAEPAVVTPDTVRALLEQRGPVGPEAARLRAVAEDLTGGGGPDRRVDDVRGRMGEAHDRAVELVDRAGERGAEPARAAERPTLPEDPAGTAAHAAPHHPADAPAPARSAGAADPAHPRDEAGLAAERLRSIHLGDDSRSGADLTGNVRSLAEQAARQLGGDLPPSDRLTARLAALREVAAQADRIDHLTETSRRTGNVRELVAATIQLSDLVRGYGDTHDLPGHPAWRDLHGVDPLDTVEANTRTARIDPRTLRFHPVDEATTVALIERSLGAEDAARVLAAGGRVIPLDVDALRANLPGHQVRHLVAFVHDPSTAAVYDPRTGATLLRADRTQSAVAASRVHEATHGSQPSWPARLRQIRDLAIGEEARDQLRARELFHREFDAFSAEVRFLSGLVRGRLAGDLEVKDRELAVPREYRSFLATHEPDRVIAQHVFEEYFKLLSDGGATARRLFGDDIYGAVLRERLGSEPPPHQPDGRDGPDGGAGPRPVQNGPAAGGDQQWPLRNERKFEDVAEFGLSAESLQGPGVPPEPGPGHGGGQGDGGGDPARPGSGRVDLPPDPAERAGDGPGGGPGGSGTRGTPDHRSSAADAGGPAGHPRRGEPSRSDGDPRPLDERLPGPAADPGGRYADSGDLPARSRQDGATADVPRPVPSERAGDGADRPGGAGRLVGDDGLEPPPGRLGPPSGVDVLGPDGAGHRGAGDADRPDGERGVVRGPDGGPPAAGRADAVPGADGAGPGRPAGTGRLGGEGRRHPDGDLRSGRPEVAPDRPDRTRPDLDLTPSDAPAADPDPSGAGRVRLQPLGEADPGRVGRILAAGSTPFPDGAGRVVHPVDPDPPAVEAVVRSAVTEPGRYTLVIPADAALSRTDVLRLVLDDPQWHDAGRPPVDLVLDGAAAGNRPLAAVLAIHLGVHVRAPDGASAQNPVGEFVSWHGVGDERPLTGFAPQHLPDHLRLHLQRDSTLLVNEAGRPRARLLDEAPPPDGLSADAYTVVFGGDRHGPTLGGDPVGPQQATDLLWLDPAWDGGPLHVRAAFLEPDAAAAWGQGVARELGLALVVEDAAGRPHPVQPGDEAGRAALPDPDAAAAELAGRDYRRGEGMLSPLDDIVLLRTRDGSAAVYRSEAGDAATMDRSLSELPRWRNRVSAYRLDSALGWGLVPTATRYEGDAGVGSLQDRVPYLGEPPARYPERDQQRLAALHYLLGLTHPDEVRTQLDGRPAGTDHSGAFPSSQLLPLRSDYLARWLGRPLDPEVVSELRRLDLGRAADILRDGGHGQAAVRGVLARVLELRGGEITGEAWPGRIADDDGHLVRDQLPDPPPPPALDPQVPPEPDRPGTVYRTLPLLPDYHGEHLAPGEHPRAVGVSYLDVHQREAFRLTFRDGLLYDSDGTLFDTADATQGHAIFVMDPQGNVYASRSHERDVFHHASLVAGEPVAASGTLTAVHGRLEYVSDVGGHYWPTRAHMMQFVDAMRARGVAFPDENLYISHPDRDAGGGGGPEQERLPPDDTQPEPAPDDNAGLVRRLLDEGSTPLPDGLGRVLHGPVPSVPPGVDVPAARDPHRYTLVVDGTVDGRFIDVGGQTLRRSDLAAVIDADSAWHRAGRPPLDLVLRGSAAGQRPLAQALASHLEIPVRVLNGGDGAGLLGRIADRFRPDGDRPPGAEFEPEARLPAPLTERLELATPVVDAAGQVRGRLFEESADRTAPLPGHYTLGLRGDPAGPTAGEWPLSPHEVAALLWHDIGWDDGSNPRLLTDVHDPAYLRSYGEALARELHMPVRVEGGDGQVVVASEEAGRPTGPNRHYPRDEARLQLRSYTDESRLDPDDGDGNVVWRLSTADGAAAVYKPVGGEDPELRRQVTASTSLMVREVAAYRLDALVGYRLVPVTTRYVGDHGAGSLQDWAPRPGLRPLQYTTLDQQRMAVFDYVAGNSDRHAGNVLTSADWRPAAIDNGLAFPDVAGRALRSSFVAEHFGRPLDPAVLEPLRRLDLRLVRRVLEDAGLEPGAVDGALVRIAEVRDAGRITGAGWPGKITDEHRVSVKMPAGFDALVSATPAAPAGGGDAAHPVPPAAGSTGFAQWILDEGSTALPDGSGRVLHGSAPPARATLDAWIAVRDPATYTVVVHGLVDGSAVRIGGHLLSRTDLAAVLEADRAWSHSNVPITLDLVLDGAADGARPLGQALATHFGVEVRVLHGTADDPAHLGAGAVGDRPVWTAFRPEAALPHYLRAELDGGRPFTDPAAGARGRLLGGEPPPAELLRGSYHLVLPLDAPLQAAEVVTLLRHDLEWDGAPPHLVAGSVDGRQLERLGAQVGHELGRTVTVQGADPSVVLEVSPAEHRPLGPNHDYPADEAELAGRPWSPPLPLASDESLVLQVRAPDGSAAVYKPEDGEPQDLSSWVGGSLWQREVAAYRIDQVIGYLLVPTTTEYRGEHGVGSLQEWMPHPGRRMHDYDELDEQRLAVFDYLIGNGDRAYRNLVSQPDFRPAAIDNGLSFPSRPDATIVSPFTHAYLSRPLDPAVVEPLRRLDLAAAGHLLWVTGLDETAVSGFLARADEVRTHGQITGAAWPGDIVDFHVFDSDGSSGGAWSVVLAVPEQTPLEDAARPLDEAPAPAHRPTSSSDAPPGQRPDTSGPAPEARDEGFNDEPWVPRTVDTCSDGALQIMLHNRDEIEAGGRNHDLGMDNDDLVDYVDHLQQRSAPRELADGTGFAYYDEGLRTVLVVKRNHPGGSVFYASRSYFERITS